MGVIKEDIGEDLELDFKTPQKEVLEEVKTMQEGFKRTQNDTITKIKPGKKGVAVPAHENPIFKKNIAKLFDFSQK